ncbi:MAG: 16S rRNA (guanine(966)-N(2))-methyltransferase RsmD [Defluviitaleaceae bacterium]|nr:16S rRNA (guanine(966)-N(2))-methyltransferase RsmD [Defluviitaleaceae bacterium]
MNVISGNAKGLKLDTPDNLHTRPTLSRVKEAFFNIIQNDIENSSFLDLYSGTGQIGIEALSRGANFCVFIDNSTEILILKNLKKTSFNKDKYEVISKDIEIAIGKFSQKFDFIYLDPPHTSENIDYIFNLIFLNKILKNNGFVIYELKTTKKFIQYENFNIEKIKYYGNTMLMFFSLKEII